MNLLRLFAALFVLPAVAGVVWSFLSLVVRLGNDVSVAVLPFWLGLGSYFVFEAVFRRPIKTYVFGHELTHAIVGIVSGARLRSFKVSSSGGSVVLTRTGLFIALAPYFIPLYTVAVIGAYYLGNRFWHLVPYYPYFLFAAGFTLSFHFALTWFALAQGQSDLRQFGVFFSGVIVALASSLLLTGILKLLFPGHISMQAFFLGAVERTVTIIGAGAEALRRALSLIDGHPITK